MDPKVWFVIAVLVASAAISTLWNIEQLETDRILGDRIDLVNARVDVVGECP